MPYMKQPWTIDDDPHDRMINPTAWPGRDSQETLPASDSQLESALKEASLGITTPENRIRRTMSQPPEISHEKTDMPPKRRRVVKVIRRKVATPQDGLTVPVPEAPPQVPPASKQPCQNEAMQLVSPGPTQAEHTRAHAEQVSSPSAPATSAATETPQPSAAATAAAIPETALETTPESEAQPRVRVIEKIQHSYWKMVRVLKLRFYWNFSTSVLKYISTQIWSNFNKIVLKWSVEIHLEMWPVNVACQFFVQVSRWLGF